MAESNINYSTIQYKNSSNQMTENDLRFGFEEAKGRFKIGPDSENEVWKTFLSSKSSTKNQGVRMDYATTHIWPSYRVQYIPSSFIYKSWSLSNWGHMQGDFQYLSGTFSSPGQTMEFDPAGGYGHFKIEAKESSMWHPLAIVVTVNEGNRNQETQEDEFFSFTKKADSWYVYDANGKKDIKDTDAINNWNTNYDIAILNRTIANDHTTITYLIRKKNIANGDSKTPLGKGVYDYDLWYNIGPNNNVTNSLSYITIDGYFDERSLAMTLNEVVNAYNSKSEYYHPQANPIKIGTWKQKSNILYYVNMAWVDKPSTTSTTPTPMSSTSVEYTDTSIVLYLYVELGISANGGHDIYWNQDVPNTSNSLSSKIPSDLNRYITVDISNNDPDYDATSKYSKFTVSRYGENYMKVTATSVANNEHNNPISRRQQDYFIDNVMYDPDGQIEWKPSASGSGPHLQPKMFNATTSDDTDNNHILNETFTVKKYTTTKPWKIKINATLAYNKYKGSTSGKLAGTK